MDEKIDDILNTIKEKLTLEGKKRVFEEIKELKSNDLKEWQDAEEFTRDYLIDKILFDILKVTHTAPKKFRTSDGTPRNVDYAVKYEKNRILLEVKPINADLYDKSPNGAVNQIKGVFRLAEAKKGYNFGIATDGLKWIFVDKEEKITDELDLRENFGNIKRYIVGEEKISERKLEDISKKFYEEYNDLLHGVKQISKKDCLVNSIEHVESEEDREEIAQIIIDRLIFIKFLQSRGIIKEDVLNFLYELEEHDLNLKLNQLFFEVMNTKERERGSVDPHFAYIPYLNGSLFERLDVEERNRGYRIKAKISRRIIEFLNKFRFIHRESLENQEDVIDPEILGYIFERAMTAIDRKGTGAYYTPKEITRYIAENTIYPNIIDNVNEFLIKEKGYKKSETIKKIDELFILRETTLNEVWNKIILNLSVCDNACGSGAFLLATANILFNLNKKINDNLGLRNSDVALKKLVLKTLYGVDINPRAIEIAMLRLWLWLVESYQPEFIEPLPNIEYNLRVGNSLIGYNDIEQFGTTKVSLDDFIETEETTKLLLNNFKKLKNKYQKSTGNEARKLRSEIEIIRDKIRKKLDKELYVEFLSKEIDLKKSEYFQFKPFHWAFEFYEVFDLNLPKKSRGFDILIGNPPYVDSEFMVKHTPNQRILLKKIFSTTKGNWDLYIPFYEQIFSLCNENGYMSYITPNKWLSIGYGKELRNFLERHLYQLCNCDEIKVFKDAGNSPILTFIKKKENKKKIKIDNFNKDYTVLTRKNISNSFLQYDNWGVLLSKNLDIVLKILKNELKLKDICDTENPFTVSESYEFKNFIFDGGKKAKSKNLKFINTGTIDKYLSLWGKKPTSYIKDKYEFPLVKKESFSKFQPKRYEQSISKKIIISGMRHFECYLDEKGNYVAGKSTIIIRKTKNNVTLEEIIALLNSSLISFYIKEVYSALGIEGGINFTSNMIDELPLPKLLHDYKNTLNSLVKKIIVLTEDYQYQSNIKNQEKVKNYMKKIDQLIYKLYGLTKEEINIIEENLKK